MDGGCDVNAMVERKDGDGDSYQTIALCQAIYCGQEKPVRLLLIRGANPNLAASDGTTPLMVAGGHGLKPIVQLLEGMGSALRFGVDARVRGPPAGLDRQLAPA